MDRLISEQELLKHFDPREDWVVVQTIKAIPSAEPCEDAISREELLKAIDTWDRFGVDDTNSLFRLDNLSLPHYVPYIHYDDVVKCIKGMPSIKPQEPSGDEWEQGYKRAWAEAEVVFEKEPKWISVSERLPGFGEKVLCQCRAGIYEVLKYTSHGWYHDDAHCYMTGFVIAWMPLPPCYDPQEGEDKK